MWMLHLVGCPEDLHFCLPSPPPALRSFCFTKISSLDGHKDSDFLTFLNMRMIFFLDFWICWNLIFIIIIN